MSRRKKPARVCTGTIGKALRKNNASPPHTLRRVAWAVVASRSNCLQTCLPMQDVLQSSGHFPSMLRLPLHLPSESKTIFLRKLRKNRRLPSLPQSRTEAESCVLRRCTPMFEHCWNLWCHELAAAPASSSPAPTMATQSTGGSCGTSENGLLVGLRCL